jgi:membrane protease YdiL (CAAX protease family)
MSEAKESPRPLFWAVLAVLAAGAALFGLRRVFFRLLPSTRTDLVTQVALTAIVLLLTCYGLLRLYAESRPPARALGIRPAPPSITGLALAVGVVLPFAGASLTRLLEARFPPTGEAEVVRQLLVSTSSLPRAIGLVVCLSIVLPLVNEICFRGALFGALVRRRALGVALVGAGLGSVLAEPDMRRWPEVLLLGLAASHVRAVSGSLLPALALHVSFGTVATIAALSGVAAGAGTAGTLLSWLALASLGYVVQLVARSNEDAEEARAEDKS